MRSNKKINAQIYQKLQLKAGEVQKEFDKGDPSCMKTQPLLESKKFPILKSFWFSTAAGAILPPMDKNQVLVYLNAAVCIKSTTLTLAMQFLKHMMTAASHYQDQAWKIIWKLQKELTTTEQNGEQRHYINTKTTPVPPFYSQIHYRTQTQVKQHICWAFSLRDIFSPSTYCTVRKWIANV